MPVLTNPKHELFAQELAKGKTQLEAYTKAGYKPDDGAAARLSGNVRVKARVLELGERTAAKTVVTAAAITERLMRLSDQAELLGDAAGIQASRACAMDAAKLNGLVVDKSTIDGSVAFTGIARRIVGA